MEVVISLLHGDNLAVHQVEVVDMAALEQPQVQGRAAATAIQAAAVMLLKLEAQD